MIKGDIMHAMTLRENVDHFRALLLEGNVYHISGFTIVPTQNNYRISKHPFRIRLPKNAFVKEINDDDLTIPFDMFSFIDFLDLADLAGKKKVLNW